MTSRIRVAQGLLVTDAAVLFCYGALSLLFVPGLPGQPYLIVAPKGEMLRKGFSAVVAAARCGKKSALVQRLTCVAALTRVGVPPLRIAVPDTRCPRIELRAAGCTLLPNEFSDVVWRWLKRLYYKAFAEAKVACPHLNRIGRLWRVNSSRL